MPESYEMLEKRANALSATLQTLHSLDVENKACICALSAENKALRSKVEDFGKRVSRVLYDVRRDFWYEGNIVENEFGKDSFYAKGFVQGMNEAERLLNEAEDLLSEKQIMIEADEKAGMLSRFLGLPLTETKGQNEQVRDSMKKGTLPEPGKGKKGKKPKPMICERCRFWEREVVQENFGVCRRRAPVVDENGHSLFPCVMKNGWCGEFESKDTQKDDWIRGEL